MIWDQLVKIALLGTERSTLDSKLETALQEAGIDTQQEHTKVLLEALAYYSTIEKAGWQAPKWKGTALPKSKEKEEKACSFKSAQHLQTLFKKYPKVLPEFVYHLKATQKSLPHEALPALFNRCLKEENLWQQLQSVIGDRGKWLLPLNPDWTPLFLEVEESKWKTGTKAERLVLLKQTRQQDAKKGLTLLQSTWEKDSVQEKAQLLGALKIGLSVSDEMFLEQCLTASRKEIRQTAAQLLSQIPTSQFLQRIQSYVEELIAFDKKKDTVLLSLPDLSNPALIKDGLSIKKKNATTKDKLKVLGKMLQVTPPTFWEKHLSESPAAIIKLFAQSEPSLNLVNALVEATALHPTPDWIKIWLEIWLVHYFEIGWDQLNMQPLLKILPNDFYNTFLLKKLKAVKSLPAEDSPLILLLALEGQVWDEQLTFVFLEQLSEWIRQNASLSWLGQSYRKLLKERAAYAINPTLHPKISAFWRIEQNNWAGWASDIQRFLNILSFRREMILEIK